MVRIIINNIEPGDMILAARAAERAMKSDLAFGAVAYENGVEFSFRRNKASISLWKQNA